MLKVLKHLLILMGAVYGAKLGLKMKSPGHQKIVLLCMIDVAYIFCYFVVTAFCSAAWLFPGYHHIYALLLEMVLALEVTAYS